jgi:hypothetical protein
MRAKVAPEKLDILTNLPASNLSISTGVSAMNKYVRYLILFLLLAYLLLLCFYSVEMTSTVVLSVLATALVFQPEQARKEQLEIYSTSMNKITDSIKEDVIDFGCQLFNLRPGGFERPGFVYILKSDKGFYKIGRSSEPMNRIKTFNVRLPMHVSYEVLIKTSDMNKLESHFHTQYAHKREAGEWFRLNRNDLFWLRNFPGALKAEELKKYNGHGD